MTSPVISEALQISNWFELIVERALDAILVADLDRRITLVNRNAETLFGYSRAELLGQPLEILVPERFRDRHPDFVASFFTAPKVRSMGAGRELFGLRKDGTEVPIEIGLNPIETTSGPFTVASIIDITERKRADERFRLVVEAAPNAMLMADLDRRITLVNRNAETLFGYSRAELLGQPLEILVPERFRDRHPDFVASFFTAPKVRSMGAGRELFGLRKDGTEVPIEIGLNPIETTTGLLTLASIIDITERKRAETDLRRRNAEFTAAQKLESVGRLAGGVAHEINTPVQFVSDNVQFMRTSMTEIITVIHAYRSLQHAVQSSGDVAAAAHAAAAAETTADLDFIVENASLAIDSAIDGLGRIATIVRSMKEFAHPDQAVKTAADLNRAIQSTLVVAHNEYKYVAEINTEFGELPPVECYLGEINQVVLNLVINAAHAIADVVKDTANLGKLTVRTRLDGEEVEIAIGDTGTGIPEAARDKIFDPFFTTKEVGKGTGQGLAIAYSVIVKKHGGTLRFETECGKGTTFFIRLPIGAPAKDLGVD